MSDINAAGQAWQTVTCRRCQRLYQCTPSDDYYGATTLEDGVCFVCLLAERGLRLAGDT